MISYYNNFKFKVVKKTIIFMGYLRGYLFLLILWVN